MIQIALHRSFSGIFAHYVVAAARLPPDCASKLLDVALKILIVWREARQTLRVLERRDEVSGVLADLHERRQDLAIIGMPRQGVRQDISRFIAAAGGIERDAVDICVLRVLGSKF